MSEAGYVNYFEILDLQENANPGEVRNSYKRRMKKLVGEIARAEITEERRAHFLLEMAQMNAALYILRDRETRDQYVEDRSELIALEKKWVDIADRDPEASDALRREFDGKVRYFLSKYVEEATTEAGRDKECVEQSRWDPAHERHASRILRHYRHRLNQDILERLPFYEVTRPDIDWAERSSFVKELISGGAS